jgi:hypothetical protein
VHVTKGGGNQEHVANNPGRNFMNSPDLFGRSVKAFPGRSNRYWLHTPLSDAISISGEIFMGAYA